MMNPDNLQVFTDEMLRAAGFGLGFLAVVLLLNTFFFMQIFFWFMRSSEKLTKPAPYKLIGRFMGAVLLMCIVQIMAILLWATAIYTHSLIDNIRVAMLFAGSCYTTLGIFSDILPTGWQSLAFYIAFSGLFSIAIATSAMMAMLSTVSKRLYKSKSVL